MSDPNGAPARGQWGTRLGFILAAAGSAVGLGNLWRFPVVVQQNGGGYFVIFYLICIAVVGVPIMISEVLIGRATQRAPVGAFTALAGENSAWRAVGWLGVIAGFLILSFYSVVGGWAMNYAFLSFFDYTAVEDPREIPDKIRGIFDALMSSSDVQIFWHTLFMIVTIGIVVGGVRRGIERWSRILMPALLMILILLLARSLTIRGNWEGLRYVFNFENKLTSEGALEALGHAFFTLSLGMGAMLTYGSYLGRDRNLVTSSVWICLLDTLIALTACAIIFPIIFSVPESDELLKQEGPGLLFKSIPIAFAKMGGGGRVLSIIFYALVVFAAVTSAVSLLEVVVSYFIDEVNWPRRRAVLVTGTVIYLFGIPSAVGAIFPNWSRVFPKNFFDSLVDFTNQWLLPVGGFLTAIYVGWFLRHETREGEFLGGGNSRRLYLFWLFCVRLVVPIAIGLVFLRAVGLLPESWFAGE